MPHFSTLSFPGKEREKKRKPTYVPRYYSPHSSTFPQHTCLKINLSTSAQSNQRADSTCFPVSFNNRSALGVTKEFPHPHWLAGEMVVEAGVLSSFRPLPSFPFPRISFPVSIVS